MTQAGRSIDELEMVGGTRGSFPDRSSVADLGAALSSIPEQVAAGFTSQFIDDPARLPTFCREVVQRAAALVG